VKTSLNFGYFHVLDLNFGCLVAGLVSFVGGINTSINTEELFD